MLHMYKNVTWLLYIYLCIVSEHDDLTTRSSSRTLFLNTLNLINICTLVSKMGVYKHFNKAKVVVIIKEVHTLHIEAQRLWWSSLCFYMALYIWTCNARNTCGFLCYVNARDAHWKLRWQNTQRGMTVRARETSLLSRHWWQSQQECLTWLASRFPMISWRFKNELHNVKYLYAN